MTAPRRRAAGIRRRAQWRRQAERDRGRQQRGCGDSAAPGRARPESAPVRLRSRHRAGRRAAGVGAGRSAGDSCRWPGGARPESASARCRHRAGRRAAGTGAGARCRRGHRAGRRAAGVGDGRGGGRPGRGARPASARRRGGAAARGRGRRRAAAAAGAEPFRSGWCDPISSDQPSRRALANFTLLSKPAGPCAVPSLRADRGLRSSPEPCHPHGQT